MLNIVNLFFLPIMLILGFLLVLVITRRSCRVFKVIILFSEISIPRRLYPYVLVE